MDTFLARVRKDVNEAGSGLGPLEAALVRVTSALPFLGMEFRIVSGVWNSPSHGGFGVEWAMSVARSGSCLVSTHDAEAGGALVFGDTPGLPDSARVVWDAYERGGVSAVRTVDGCFSAIVFDARAGQAVVVSDMIGQRALRIAATPEGHVLSPHDACLVACGAVAVEFDAVSLLSCLVVENSIQARSILTQVTGLEGNDVVWFRAGREMERQRVLKIDFSNRIAAKDHAAQVKCRERTLDLIMESASQWVRHGRPIRCELTAGLDSRVALACLLGAGGAPFIETLTSGEPGSVDVRTAARLAKLANVRHSRMPWSALELDQFRDNATLRAFVMNGETDAKRATKALPAWDPDGAIRVEGSTGEVFRGFLYQYAGVTGDAPDDPAALADLILARRTRRFSKIPVADEALRAELGARVHRCFGEYFDCSPNGNDVLDMFYLFERCAHWSSQVKRSSWGTARNPFVVGSAIREAYRIPPPLGQNIGVHAIAIRRYFPAAQWVLINGSRPLFAEGPGRLKSTVRFGLTAARTMFDKLNYRVNRASRTQGASQADAYAGELYPLIHDLMTAKDAVAVRALGSTGVSQVLAEHKSRKNHLALLGYAITQELYYRFLLQVRPA